MSRILDRLRLRIRIQVLRATLFIVDKMLDVCRASKADREDTNEGISIWRDLKTDLTLTEAELSLAKRG